MLSKQVGNNQFKTKFPGISPNLVDMLEALLKFNPEDRATVKECLNNSMFNSFRNTSLELDAPRQVNLPLDDVPTLDYDKVEDLKSLDQLIGVL